MKKQLILMTTILVLSSLAISAQNNPQTKSKIRIGVLGGINLADIKSNSNQDKETYLAPAFGLTAEFPVIHNLSVKVEPMYLNKGAKLMEGEDPMEEPEAHLKSSYLELPVLFKYSFLEEITPYLLTGITMGYQLDTKLDVKFPGLETTIEMKDVTENFEFGLSFGGGLEIPINSINLFFDCRYNIGLTNMQKTGSVTANVGGVQIPIDYDKDENEYKNRSFQVLIGLTIPIQK
ncbi:porin family protein [Bacteroidota bacterium]